MNTTTSPSDATANDIDRQGTTAAGQRLLSDAARRMARHASVSAQIRQQIHLLGQQLVGEGTYYQQGPNHEKLVRLELKIQADDQATNLLQVCDGRFLWIHQSLPVMNRPEDVDTLLRRVDLRRVRRALESDVRPAAADSMVEPLVFGGLPELLDQMHDNFAFEAPQLGTWRDVPVWTLRGTWKPQALINILPEITESPSLDLHGSLDRLPSHMPTSLVVVLGRDDLFPYQIQFLRPARSAAQPSTLDPNVDSTDAVVTMQLFEVSIGELIDPLLFGYKPGDTEVHDVTDEYLERLGLVTES